MAIALIKDVGVPAAAFVMMYALYVRTQRWQQKQQEDNQKWQQEQQKSTEMRFYNLVQCFIKNIREITDSNNKALENHIAALEKNTAKLDEHVRSKDEFMEFIKDERREQVHG